MNFKKRTQTVISRQPGWASTAQNNNEKHAFTEDDPKKVLGDGSETHRLGTDHMMLDRRTGGVPQTPPNSTTQTTGDAHIKLQGTIGTSSRQAYLQVKLLTIPSNKSTFCLSKTHTADENTSDRFRFGIEAAILLTSASESAQTRHMPLAFFSRERREF